MKTTERQRRRKMALGLFAAGVALIITVGLATLGSMVLGNSQLGTQVDTGDLEGPVRRLPESYTALIGVTDASGRITSVAALAIAPTGVGGAIMPLSASADVGAGRTGTLRPLSASVAQQGADSFRKDAESISNISFDMAEIVDAGRFEQLFGPVGPIDVSLLTPVADSASGMTWEAGDYSLEIADAATLITATNVYVQDWYQDAARYGIWRGIALRAGGSDQPFSADLSVAPRNMDEFVQRLLAGSVQERGLGIVGVDEQRVVDELDPDLRSIYGTGGVPSVVVHDPSEATVVGSAVAPGRLGAPLDAARYRIVVAFDEADLQGRDFNLAQAAREAVDRLSFSKVNIPSVVLLNEPGRPQTLVEVARAEDIDAAKATAEKLFGGEVEARVAPEPIVGIDVQIFLGRPFLETVEGPLTDFVGPNTMELNSNQPLSDSPPPTTTTTIAPPTTTAEGEGGDETGTTTADGGDESGDDGDTSTATTVAEAVATTAPTGDGGATEDTSGG